MMYDVSILVPIYNGEKHIERCLHSLFGQTYQNIQFIFVNDYSPDDSIALLYSVLEKYPHRKASVNVIEHEKNKGLAGARNTGIENAQGEYIIHIDSDDYVEVEMVEEMLSIAKKNDADIVVADYFLQWEKTTKYVRLEVAENKDEYVKSLLNSEALPAVWNKMFRRELYTTNKITANEGINFGEDITVTPKLAYYSQKIVKLNKAFVHYVQYNNNSYSKKVTDKNIQDVIFTLDYLKNFFSTVPKQESYLEALKVGKLKKKLEFLKHCEGKQLNKILNVFQDDSLTFDSSKFSLFDRILLNLTNRNIKLVKIATYAYKKTFITVQYLKGR